MKNLSIQLKKQAAKYSNLSNDDKKELLNTLYVEKGMSWRQIADLCGTYPNKVSRDAKKFQIKSRDKSEAQALAIQEGRHDHPTKGKGHKDETKIQISESVSTGWDNMDEDKRKSISDKAKERWAEKTPEEIAEFRKAAGDAVRKAAKEGSALEKYLLEGLISEGHRVQFHKKHWVTRENLEIDLFLPVLNVAIEVDGPSHFRNIWGAENLAKNKQRDNEKNGMLLSRNCIIIRVQQKKALSNKFKRDILKSLLDQLAQIKKKRPSKGNRIIILGDLDD